MRSIAVVEMFLLAMQCCSVGMAGASDLQGGELPLYVGWSTIDITPDRPVALVGQLNKRISQRVRDPLTATALAMETRDQDGRREQAVLVSCDVLFIRKSMQDRIKDALKTSLSDFDADKLFLNATHTHTGPGFSDEDFGTLYDVTNDPEIMKASDYGDFFVRRIAQVAVDAWQRRKPAGTSWALGHAVVGTNRRARYFDGTAIMYGATTREGFAGIEGYEDHGVEMLFFWDPNGNLTGIVINLACTAQETEGLSEVSADFWHDVRIELHKRIAEDVNVFPQCAAAGDQSPHRLYRTKAEEAMIRQRGLSNRQEIARRIVNAVEEVLPLARKTIQTRLVFRHTVARVNLPAVDATLAPFYRTDATSPIEVHVLRLGDVAMATNPFELYLDYGVRIKARSPAIVTMLVQLSCQNCGYLPTTKAVEGGGYSADKYVVGPEGGQILVDETIRQIETLWK